MDEVGHYVDSLLISAVLLYRFQQGRFVDNSMWIERRDPGPYTNYLYVLDFVKLPNNILGLP